MLFFLTIKNDRYFIVKELNSLYLEIRFFIIDSFKLFYILKKK